MYYLIGLVKRYICYQHLLLQVHKDWGASMSHLVEGGGTTVLITLENGTLNPALVRHVADSIITKAQPHKCQPLRWCMNHLLVQFASTVGYESLGKQFMEGKLDDCDGFKVTMLERKYDLDG